MKRNVFITALAFLLLSLCGTYDAKAQSDETARVDYSTVRIKKIPVAMQCWTFRKFTFFETLEKVNELDIKHLQPYPGQTLSRDTGDVKFGPDLTDEQVKLVKNRLMKHVNV